MSTPVIFAVDDDPQVLNAVRRDLRSHFAPEYRVLDAGSGAEALEAVEALKARGDTVALFLVDQRMPSMTGTEFLVEARKTYPDAKRALLTAYADTDAAISAINEVDLDHYLMKPWDPPEDNLYPILDDLLDDWVANTPAPFDGIRVVGTTWSPATHDVKDFLARNQVPYRFLDIERDEDAAAIVDAGSDGAGSIPVVLFPDGTSLVQPERRALAEQVGLRTEADNPFYDLIIIGGGPAGLAGAVYGASEGLSTVMVEAEAPGGQAGTSSRIENYLGFPAGVSGGDLARRAVTQATRLGAEILSATAVTEVKTEDQIKVVTLDTGDQLRCHALIIASGMALRKLSVPGYERYEGAGVYYGAALSEAASYKDRHVFVIGGANSAGQAAMLFARYASTVSMVVRGESLVAKMSTYLIDQIDAQPNIELIANTQVVAVEGEERVERIRLKNNSTDEETVQEAAAIFIFVGAVPHSDFVAHLVARNERGFIYTGPDLVLASEDFRWTEGRDPLGLETSVPGIFAAGDIRHDAIRRVASAVGSGSVAVTLVHQYLDTV
ncbi:MAG: FAD-dependent oxidoreductase [Acidobacteria bacterium]|nr:FAD-dependent oxidoreductase [Acidobacteriota bacterium]